MASKYPYFEESVPIELLKLDPNNPRLPDYVQNTGEEAIIEHMILEESTLELMQAIGEKGFFKGEQLLVVPNGENYIVVEGNRRLTSVKLLNDPAIAKVQSSIVNKIVKQSDTKLPITSLPCMVFEKDEDIHDYLGYRHVTGIQPWNLRQKAKYLQYLREKNYAHLDINAASNELRKIIASKTPVVKRYLVGYEIFTLIKDNDFYKIKGLTSDDFHFSSLSDSLGWSNIRSFLSVDMDSDNPTENLNTKHLRLWTEWIFQPLNEVKNTRRNTRLKGKSQDLKKLNAILGSEIARCKFIDDNITLDEAYLYTEVFDDLFSKSITEAIKMVETANSVVNRVTNFYPSYVDDLRLLIKLSRTIKSSIDELQSNEFSGDEFKG